MKVERTKIKIIKFDDENYVLGLSPKGAEGTGIEL